jgi:hypothetical protein
MRAALLLLLLVPAAHAQKWRMSYFYDHPREQLYFTDLAFLSANRGVAVGSIVDESTRKIKRHLAVLTSDGGKQWTQVPLPDAPISLFFLDESIGWVVTSGGIYKTEESGRGWVKLSGRNKINSLWFFDAKHGIAAAEKTGLLETQDGGRIWTPIKIDFKLDKNYGVYLQRIAFVTPLIGLVTGEAVVEKWDKNRHLNHLLVQAETRDGGATWKTSSVEINLAVTDLALRRTEGLVVLNGTRSRVARLDLSTGESSIVYGSTDTPLSVALFQGHAFLAVSHQPNRLTEKLRILESRDLVKWTEMPLDYRAEGTNAILAGPDPGHMFLATSRGMILRLDEPAKPPR